LFGSLFNDITFVRYNSDFTQEIEEYMRRQHNILVGERTAEQIKIEVGAAIIDLDDPPPPYAVRGRDLMSGIPREIMITHDEVASALDKTIAKIEEAILSALAATPPELSADIYKTGIYLAGGGSMLRGLDKRIADKTKLPVHIAENPLRAVALGTSIALKNIDKYQFLIRD
jgi:rod shape-determining protein MreB